MFPWSVFNGLCTLRGVQGLGYFSEVQVAAHGLLNKTELMQVHGVFRIRKTFIMPF